MCPQIPRWKETQDLWHIIVRKSRGHKNAGFVAQCCPQILQSKETRPYLCNKIVRKSCGCENAALWHNAVVHKTSRSKETRHGSWGNFVCKSRGHWKLRDFGDKNMNAYFTSCQGVLRCIVEHSAGLRKLPRLSLSTLSLDTIRPQMLNNGIGTMRYRHARLQTGGLQSCLGDAWTRFWQRMSKYSPRVWKIQRLATMIKKWESLWLELRMAWMVRSLSLIICLKITSNPLTCLHSLDPLSIDTERLPLELWVQHPSCLLVPYCLLPLALLYCCSNDCSGIVEPIVFAGFAGLYYLQILWSLKNARFEEEHYPQIPRSLQCMEFVGSTWVELFF